MGVTNELPPKRDVAIALLEASSIYVHLDPRAAGVMVPAWFKKQPQLVLQVGLNMPVPIPDLDVGEDGISCTLSFNRRPEYCRIPWSAVYGLVGEDGRGMIWPEDVPPEVAAQAQGRAAAPKEQRRLRAVPEAGSAPEAKPEEAEAKSPVASSDKAEVAARTKPEGARAQKGAASAPKARASSSKRAQPDEQAAAPSAPAAEGPAAKVTEPKASQAKSPQAEAPQAKPSSPDTASDETPSEREGAGAGRAKRELPPYLRVVK